MLSKEIVGCLVLSAVATCLYYYVNKKEDKEDIDYFLYGKVFGLVFVICYIGSTFLKSSDMTGGSSDAFLEQDYSKCVPDLQPKKFKKKMKGPSISIDKLKLLDPVSLDQTL